MCGHVMRGRFAPRCAECAQVDYSTAWPLEVRIPVLIVITVLFVNIHPAINNLVKRVVWIVVKPMALLIGYLCVAFVRTLLFIFIDGPKIVAGIIAARRNKGGVDVLGSLDTENNTKLNAIMGRIHANMPAAWVPGEGSVFDKKYKPFLTSDDMKFHGPHQKEAMTRERNNSC